MNISDCRIINAIQEVLTFFDADISSLEIGVLDSGTVSIKGSMVTPGGQSLTPYMMSCIDSEIRRLDEVSVVEYSLDNMSMFDGKWQGVIPFDRSLKLTNEMISKLKRLGVTRRLSLPEKKTRHKTHKVLQISSKRTQQVLWKNLSEVMYKITKKIEHLRPRISITHFLKSAYNKMEREVTQDSHYQIINNYICKMLKINIFNANSWKALVDNPPFEDVPQNSCASVNFFLRFTMLLFDSLNVILSREEKIELAKEMFQLLEDKSLVCPHSGNSYEWKAIFQHYHKNCLLEEEFGNKNEEISKTARNKPTDRIENGNSPVLGNAEKFSKGENIDKINGLKFQHSSLKEALGRINKPNKENN